MASTADISAAVKPRLLATSGENLNDLIILIPNIFKQHSYVEATALALSKAAV